MLLENRKSISAPADLQERTSGQEEQQPSPEELESSPGYMHLERLRLLEKLSRKTSNASDIDVMSTPFHSRDHQLDRRLRRTKRSSESWELI